MIYYLVTPKCIDPNGDTLYLTAQQSTDSVAVASLLPNNDPSQIWTPVEYLPGGIDQGFVLLNQQTNKVIAAPHNNKPVGLISVSDVATSRATWKLIGQNYGALQLQQNTDMNLNVRGDGPYPSGTAVFAFKWDGGGNPNEVWTFELVAPQAQQKAQKQG